MKCVFLLCVLGLVAYHVEGDQSFNFGFRPFQHSRPSQPRPFSRPQFSSRPRPQFQSFRPRPHSNQQSRPHFRPQQFRPQPIQHQGFSQQQSGFSPNSNGGGGQVRFREEGVSWNTMSLSDTRLSAIRPTLRPEAITDNIDITSILQKLLIRTCKSFLNPPNYPFIPSNHTLGSRQVWQLRVPLFVLHRQKCQVHRYQGTLLLQ